MLTSDELQAMPIAQVRAYAANMGLGAPFNEKKNDLINRVVVAQSTAIEPKKPEAPKVKVVKEVETPDHEAIRDALKPYTDAGLVLKLEGDQFEMRHKGRVDSGNIKQPLRTLVRLAEFLTR